MCGQWCCVDGAGVVVEPVLVEPLDPPLVVA
jgi:hypothetical protein